MENDELCCMHWRHPERKCFMNRQEDKREKILVTRSSMPSYEEYIEMIKPIWDSAWMTNMGDLQNSRI